MNIEDAVSILVAHRNGIIDYDREVLKEAAQVVKSLAPHSEWEQDESGGWNLWVRTEGEEIRP